MERTYFDPRKQPLTRDLTVGEPGLQWIADNRTWELIQALLGGTPEMQRGGERWLKRRDMEDDFQDPETGKLITPYLTRLSQANCPPYYENLRNTAAGMLARVPIAYSDDFSDSIKEDLKNVNGQGHSLQAWFTGSVLDESLDFGYGGILVETAATGDGDPWWSWYNGSQVLSTLYLRDNDGIPYLARIRLLDQLTEPYGDYGEKCVLRVRVFEKLTADAKVQVSVWRNDPGSGLATVEGGGQVSGNFIMEGPVLPTDWDEIPWAPFYEPGTRPPLAEVAFLNLKSYNDESDLADQIAEAANEIIALFNFDPDLGRIKVGSRSGINMPENGDIKRVGLSGTSFSPQFDQLTRTDEQTENLGMVTIIGQKAGVETAHAKELDRSQGDSPLQRFAAQWQETLNRAVRLTAEAINADPAEAGTLTVSREFVEDQMPLDAAEFLLRLNQEGHLSDRRLLELLGGGNLLGDEFDLDEEMRDLEQGRAENQERLAERMRQAIEESRDATPPEPEAPPEPVENA